MSANPNEYDDDLYLDGLNKLDEAVGILWDAGAEEDEIRGAVDNAIESVV